MVFVRRRKEQLCSVCTKQNGKVRTPDMQLKGNVHIPPLVIFTLQEQIFFNTLAGYWNQWSLLCKGWWCTHFIYFIYFSTVFFSRAARSCPNNSCYCCFACFEISKCSLAALVTANKCLRAQTMKTNSLRSHQRAKRKEADSEASCCLPSSASKNKYSALFQHSIRYSVDRGLRTTDSVTTWLNKNLLVEYIWNVDVRVITTAMSSIINNEE